MMVKKVRSAIEKYNMLVPGEAVTAALSGGADSTALLLVLKELGYKVSAVHINHNLRGEESMRDENFCRELCQKYEIPLTVERVDVKGYCREKKCSVELGARELRYGAIYKSAPGKIATAHTLSDCLETTIFNLTRGTGVHGMASIPPVRGRLIRPLINCTREEIERYLKKKGEKWVEDSTNLLPNCSRNIIRLEVIPKLKKINPGLMTSFLGTIEALREADRYIESEAQRIVETSKDDYGGIRDSAVFSRALAIRLSKEGIEPSAERIVAVKTVIRGGGRINIKKGVYIRGCMGKLIFERSEQNESEEYEIDLRVGAEMGDKIVVVTKISPFDISEYQKNVLKYLFDDSKISGNYIVRHVKGGEKIRLPNRGITSTVKKLLLPEERLTKYVIADSHGPVFVEGIGVSERIACDEKTKSAWKIDIKEREK